MKDQLYTPSVMAALTCDCSRWKGTSVLWRTATQDQLRTVRADLAREELQQ